MNGVPQRGADIASLAERLGRKRVKRGSEPTFESQVFNIPVLTIPMHGSKTVSRGTQRSILMQLEDDLIAWEQKFDEEERYAAALKIEKQKRGLT
jgi:predicted RNA binding protein YcfA (HicA-like mRNA interferase family)